MIRKKITLDRKFCVKKQNKTGQSKCLYAMKMITINSKLLK